MLHALKKMVNKGNGASNGASPVVHMPMAHVPDLTEQKFIQEISQLPKYTKLLTGPKSKFAISETLYGKLAAVSLSNQVAFVMADPESYKKQDFASLIERLRREFASVQHAIAKSSVILSLYAKEETQKRDRSENETSLSIQLFYEILNAAASAGASDVHFVITEDGIHETTAILFRIDGIIRRYDQIPSRNALEAVGVAYTKLAEDSSRSDTAFNRRAKQSCSIPIILNGKHYKLRYQSIDTNSGLDVIIRLLQTASTNDQNSKTLEELGYSHGQCQQLDYAARKSVGTIIISGVTGSGKSTTLKTMMTVSPHRLAKKAYSIEDPVEYKMFGVSQISVQRNANERDSSGFTAAMRVVLRADPDIVMVGEVRDTETSSLLKTMVQSGHQVMTTVHAASAIDIIQRLTSSEMGMPRETIAARNFLSALVYQRLIAKLCPYCKIKAVEAGDDQFPAQTRDILATKFGLNPETMFITNPQGCEHCDGYGTKGVTVVAEVLIPDNTTLKLLREGKDVEAEEYWRSTRRTDFSDPDTWGKTALEHALYKAHIGLVDPLVVQDQFEPFEIYNVVEIA